ncbi:MAG: tetraacyldisaccharide 4'-kinase [Candidimonas sp.]|nr:MAG: tetraacyldisaccharide 4'-kinase [Candidimonas sp.]TAM20295.1 MAG: tetraacyldisaccharide 4'-kinase [Candidimonas sp.]TAM79920.1 MAG: tetraacyldisaccharide 4'-kinase [Candidimonas sp.]
MKPALIASRALHRIWVGKGLISTLLLPISWLVGAFIAHKRRRYQSGRKQGAATSCPVIVVGNLYVGGTGKTPVVLALVKALQACGWNPGIISRGYGARLLGHARTGRGGLDPQEFGDEPALIARISQAPIAVHPRRALALRALQAQYPEVDLVISDDGLQHLALARDVEIVVQDARGTGNGRLLPAGPLREPTSRLSGVDYVITNLTAGQSMQPLTITGRQIRMQLVPDTVCHLVSGQTLQWADWHNRYQHTSLSAAAGIGQPERFFGMLRACGLELTQTMALPDHDPYHRSPFDSLDTDLILITSKDAVKCARFKDERLWEVRVLPQFSDPSWLNDLNEQLNAIVSRKISKNPPGELH